MFLISLPLSPALSLYIPLPPPTQHQSNNRIEEAKRAIKRSAPPPADTDRYGELDRKRSATDRRFEAPPPPRFDNFDREKKRLEEYSSSTSSSKRNDDYKSSRGAGGSSSGGGGLSSDMSSTFKRPLNDYPKRDHDPPSRSGGNSGGGGGYDTRGSALSSMSSRFDDSRGNNSSRSRPDDRDRYG